MPSHALRLGCGRTRRPWRAALAWRLAVLWMAAIVLPVQGVAGCVYTVLGPLHVHARMPARTEATPKLVDLRRAAYGSTAVATMQVALDDVGAAHHSLPQRHHHAFGDGSVEVVVGADLGAADHGGSDDGHGAAASLAALAAVAPSPVAWQPAVVGARTASRPAWAPSSAEVRLPERPPRRLIAPV